jgi:anti-sigma B factor antagonist
MHRSPARPTPSGPAQRLSVGPAPADRSDQVVVRVAGEVDTFTAPLLDGCLRSQTRRRKVHEVVVDLCEVTFLGAAGITVLARAQRRCRMRGARFVVHTGGSRGVQLSLQLSGLDDVVPVDPVG